MTDEGENDQSELISFSDFLESTPPNQTKKISDMWHSPSGVRQLQVPAIRLHCSSEECKGSRVFRRYQSSQILSDRKEVYLYFKCSNCEESIKIISLIIAGTVQEGIALKLGEFPAFGAPTPNKLLDLIDGSKETFLKGRRCETQGLGVGAFAYYRRVVETQRDRIFDEIIEVAKKVNLSKENLAILENAKSERQFKRSLEMVGEAMPESLLVDGHSPIAILHSALSSGVHDLSDNECLEMAETIRLVLGDLAERLSQALKSDSELKKALGKLMRSNQD